MEGTESDVSEDPHVAESRRTGGRPADEPDKGGTTGTADNEEFVGRVAGEDASDAEDSGAEARAEDERRG